MKNNNRNRGHNYERKIRKELKEFFPDCETSRYASREMDDKKVDLVRTGCFNVQIKTSKQAKKIQHTVLDEMPDDEKINVCVLQMTKKSPSGRFLSNGEYVIIKKEDFYGLLREGIQIK